MRKSARTIAAATALAATLLACSGGGRRGPSPYSQKLVILGFDGMDPHLLDRWMGEGKLPNIAKLAHQGGSYPLGTTHSPESPTAWASFATGMNAGKHNIYDFLVRDTSTYLPDLGMVKRTPPKFLFSYFPILEAQARIDARRHVLLGHRRARRCTVRHPHRSRHLSARRRAERRAVGRPAAARYPGHDGNVFLLRDRPESLRRGKHGNGRHPQAPGVRGGYRQHRARGTAEPDRPAADRSDSEAWADARARAIARASRSCRQPRTSGCR